MLTQYFSNIKGDPLDIIVYDLFFFLWLIFFSVLAIRYFISLLGSLIFKSKPEHTYIAHYGAPLMLAEMYYLTPSEYLIGSRFALLLGLWIFSLLCAALQIKICKRRSIVRNCPPFLGRAVLVTEEKPMISKERAEELMARFAAEYTSNPASQIWRLELNEEEKALVATWDGVIVRILLDALKQQTPEL